MFAEILFIGILMRDCTIWSTVSSTIKSTRYSLCLLKLTIKIHYFIKSCYKIYPLLLFTLMKESLELIRVHSFSITSTNKFILKYAH